jgi:hypothetical protein
MCAAKSDLKTGMLAIKSNMVVNVSVLSKRATHSANENALKRLEA